MATFYLDASALVKVYVAEPGNRWMQSIVDSGVSHLLLTSRITVVEVVCALARRRREGSLALHDYRDALHAFRYDVFTRYKLVEVDARVSDMAVVLADKHPLRAYDALQLASALVANQFLAQAGLSPLIFLSADHRLLSIAVVEGLLTDDPNAYP